MHYLFILVLAALGLCSAWAVSPDQAGGDAAAYERSQTLRERYRGLVSNERLWLRWIEGGKRFYYRFESSEGHAFRLGDTESGEQGPLFDHTALAELLGEKSRETTIDAQKLPFRELDYDPEKKTIRFRCLDARWEASLQPELSLHKMDPPKAEDRGAGKDSKPEETRRSRSRRNSSERDSGYEAESPDERYVAFFRKHNVFVRIVEDGEVIQLSNDGTEEESYGAPVFWAPDSKRLAVWKTKKGKERLVHYVDTAPDDQLQPKHFTRSYAKPGDEIDVRSPHIFTTGWTSRHTRPNEELFPHPFVTRNLTWLEDSSAVRFEYIDRGFGVHRVLELHAGSGKTRVVVDESSDTFVDVFHKGYRRDLVKTSEILWTSERDGWNHLYLLDFATGELKRQVTQGPWVFRGVEHLDESGGELSSRPPATTRIRTPTSSIISVWDSIVAKSRR